MEVRECWSTSAPDYLNYIATLAEWPGLRSIAIVQAERRLGDETTVKRRYFISSLKSDAKLLLHAVRTHWEIENKVHWVLDIGFREDDCRIRAGNGAENFAVLRHIALNLLRQEKTSKGSLKGRRKKAGGTTTTYSRSSPGKCARPIVALRAAKSGLPICVPSCSQRRSENPPQTSPAIVRQAQVLLPGENASAVPFDGLLLQALTFDARC